MWRGFVELYWSAEEGDNKMEPKPLFSIVIPVYKNEANLPITIPYIIDNLNLFPDYNVELVLVNDGSPDNSYEIMKQYQKKYPKLIRIANLTRNFGQSAAMRCGMEMAKGDVIGIISADLQDPFELFVDMLKEWKNSYKFVIATRAEREEKGLSVVCSKIFHHLVNQHINNNYPVGGFDFFLIDRVVKDRYISMDRVPSSSQLLLLWMGYNHKEIKYIRKVRKIGKSGYNLASKIDVAIRIFVSWTDYPIKTILFLGIFLVVAGFLGCMVDIIFLLFFSINLCMIADITLILCIFVGMLMAALGLVGEYIWSVFELNKQFPRYLIDDIVEDVKE